VSDRDLMELMRAIAAGQSDVVDQMLRAAPALALAPLVTGATRTGAPDYWLEDIAHYVYAGDTPLHVAAAAHRPAMATTLLELAADVTAVNRRRAQPLHYAADGHPGTPHWRPDQQATVIGLLIDAGADPNARDLNGASPLHRAIRTRCAAAVRVLLERGADPNQTNRFGSTPTSLATRPSGRGGSGGKAAKEQQAEIVRLLEEALLR